MLCFKKLQDSGLQLQKNYPQYFQTYLTGCLAVAKRSPSRDITYLCGDVGIYTNVALTTDDSNTRSQAIKVILGHYPTAIDPSFTSPELLYGRVGYLTALIQLWHAFGPEAIDQKKILDLIEIIINQGRTSHGKCPLVYSWHDKMYWGAAHGTTGILFVLLSVHESFLKQNREWCELIKSTVDYLVNVFMNEPSGNFPSRQGGTVNLVQWCHGSPALVFLLSLAHSLWKEELYCRTLHLCGDVIWKKGFLCKGAGLCHGIAGNGYALLSVYKTTGDLKYLHRTIKFVEAYFSPKFSKLFQTPDHPWSLYGGLSGLSCLLMDLVIDPKNALFPAFQDLVS
eukprot:TRINITY_DN5383_c0_g1_i7.p1 TRINITY_DN5383_c0_g1~~TRINITY_DN5383_c0_g1_i7.p1  ORF type:complete len:339 (+),score=57.73 TRINITY_DN5383_c0_g1_i7:435-1451(+)